MKLFPKTRHRLHELELKLARMAKVAPVATEMPAAKTVQVGSQPLVYGLDWRYYASGAELRKTLLGCLHTPIDIYATSTTNDMVGLAQSPVPSTQAKAKGPGTDKAKGKPHAAALVVAENLSRGGVELFVFQFADDLFGITVLEDARPVSRFDQLGTRSDILTLVGQFQLEQAGQDFRLVGNTGLLDNEEPADIADVFFSPSSAALIRSVPNYPRRLLVGLATVLLVVLVSLIWGWVNIEKLKRMQAESARKQNPDFIYEQSVATGMQALNVGAQDQLNAWRAIVLNIPESTNGWALSKVSCKPGSCEALWDRTFGSYRDFDVASLSGVANTLHNHRDGDPTQSSIQTTWNTTNLSNSKPPLTREKLPMLKAQVLALSSQLQDLALLENGQVRISSTELHPKVPGLEVSQISKPVVKGQWSVRHHLWTLGDLEVNGQALAVDELLLERDAVSKQWMYTLKGNYYAKGSSF